MADIPRSIPTSCQNTAQLSKKIIHFRLSGLGKEIINVQVVVSGFLMKFIVEWCRRPNELASAPNKETNDCCETLHHPTGLSGGNDFWMGLSSCEHLLSVYIKHYSSNTSFWGSEHLLYLSFTFVSPREAYFHGFKSLNVVFLSILSTCF